jgi:putative restriction endonuclease
MNLWIGITDGDWYRHLRAQPDLDEVNFWQPSGRRQFRALAPGEPFLFKLHSPDNFIVGGGFFATSSIVPSSLAWEIFGEKNGAADFAQMRARIEHYRKVAPNRFEDYSIGCTILHSPFFAQRQLVLCTDDNHSCAT